MFRSKYLALVAATAAFSVGSVATAADFTPVPVTHPYMLDDTTMPSNNMAPNNGSPSNVAPDKDTGAASAPSTPATRPLLMQAFDGLGNIGGGMDNLHLALGGYVEGSWTYSARPPAGNVIGGRAFDTKTESIQFDAVDLTFTRIPDATYKNFDFGFTIETMYGFDPAYFHSNGLSIYSPPRTASPIPGAGSTFTIHPKAQFDLTQAYGFLVLPFGNGLGIQFGKFDTLLGYEVIDSNYSESSGHPITFFSRSFIFQQEPFTHTGALAVYNLIDPTGDNQLVATAGITRGWDQATKDDNGSIDYTGQLKFTTPKYSITFSGITGQEEASPTFGLTGLSGYRTVLDLDAQYSVSDNFTLATDLMYAWENQTSEGGNGGGIGQWYAAAVYASYKQSDVLTFNIRGEWFNDPDGAAPTEYLTGGFNPVFGKAVGTPNEYFEATVGLNICPFAANKYLSGFHIRPEFRWDYSDHSAWNGGTQHDQWTGAIEAYFTF